MSILYVATDLGHPVYMIGPIRQTLDSYQHQTTSNFKQVQLQVQTTTNFNQTASIAILPPGCIPAWTTSWTSMSFGADEVSPIRPTGTSTPQYQLFFTPSPESLVCVHCTNFRNNIVGISLYCDYMTS